jgi:hypothetical protein
MSMTLSRRIFLCRTAAANDGADVPAGIAFTVLMKSLPV